MIELELPYFFYHLNLSPKVNKRVLEGERLRKQLITTCHKRLTLVLFSCNFEIFTALIDRPYQQI